MMTVAVHEADLLVQDPTFPALKQHVIGTTGLSYYHDRDRELASYLLGHFTKLGIRDCGTYLRLLCSGPAGDRELDHLIQDLTIGETFFFRHSDLIHALEHVFLPQAIAKNRAHRRLRIWSAGSSIGAEAYTISILLRRNLAHLLAGWDLQIVGTDINRSFLSRAERGQFDPWSLRGVSDEIKRDCFSQSGRKWTLHPEYREGVCFQYHNLAKHPFPSLLHNLFAFDVILCRNVMIYFSQTVIERVVRNLRRCLVDEGWLLVGHAEHNLERFRHYRTVQSGEATAYQRVDAARPQPTVPAPAAASPPRPGAAGTGPSTFTMQSIEPAPRPLPGCDSPTRDESVNRLENRRPHDQIRQLADAGQLVAAERRCVQLAASQSNDSAAQLYHALILQQMERLEESEAVLRRTLQLAPQSPLTYYYLGLTLSRRRRRVESGQAFRQAARLLAGVAPEQLVEDGDGLTVSELGGLVALHLRGEAL